MTKKQLFQVTGISKSTIDKMSRGENVSLEIIDRICSYFNCALSSVVEYVNSENTKQNDNE